MDKKLSKFPYAPLTRAKREQISAAGTVSIALASGIAAPKEPTLFDELEEEKALNLQAIDDKHFVDRKGKPIALTRFQNKLIYALSYFMSQHKEEEEIQQYVAALRTGKQPRSRITIAISVTELTKFMSTEGKAKTEQKKKILAELDTVADIKQVQTYGKGEDRIQLVASLISIPERIVDLSPDKRLDADFVNVTYGSIFFYEMYSRYAIVKPPLFQLWGKKGNGTDTELFSVLLSDLLAKYSAHRIAAIRASKMKRKPGQNWAEYKDAQRKAIREALTYSEYAYTIRSRVTKDYESTRKQRADFDKDLFSAIRAYQEIGLITEATIQDTAKGKRVDFIYNIDYVKDEPDNEKLIVSSTEEEPEPAS